MNPRSAIFAAVIAAVILLASANLARSQELPPEAVPAAPVVAPAPPAAEPQTPLDGALSRLPDISTRENFSAAMQIVLSAWTTSAGRSMTAIAVTKGRDVTYLMSAVGRLRWIYGVQRALIVLTVALMCVGVALWLAKGSLPVRWLFRG